MVIPLKKHFPKILGCVIGIIFYGELWGLLMQLVGQLPETIYPWSVLTIALHYAINAKKTNILLFITGILPMGAACFFYYKKYVNDKFSKIYGDAHWATPPEIKKMGLFNPKGDMVIGWKNDLLLMTKLVSHVLVFAPSRSGKGVSQVIPNALVYKGSLLVTDMKLEVFEATSGFREKCGQAVYLFSPGSPDAKTHCFNPLEFIQTDRARSVAEVQMVAEILVKEGKDEQGKDDIWVEEARALAVGLLLWLKETDRPFTLGELNNVVKGTPNFEGFINALLESSVIADNVINIHPIAFLNLNNFYQKAEKERSAVKSSLAYRLNLWDDPYVVAATAKSDFDLRDLRKKPMTIYLGIPTNQLKRLAPLMNLFVQQFLMLITEKLPSRDEPHHVLLLLDEFCNLGRMENLRKGLSFLAGYHVHCMPIVQNIGQLFDDYGQYGTDTFFQNIDYKIMYRQNSLTDQRKVSEYLGKRTVKTRSHGRQTSAQRAAGESQHEQDIEQPLLTPDEVGSFPLDKAIVQLSGKPPVVYTRSIFYQEQVFKERLLPPADIPTIQPCFPIIRVKKSVVKDKSLESKPEQSATLEEVEEALNIL